MNYVEDFVRKRTKQENEEGDTLSEWAKAVCSLIQIRIRKLKRPISAKATYVFKDADVTETLSTIHDKYVVVPADKAFATPEFTSVSFDGLRVAHLFSFMCCVFFLSFVPVLCLVSNVVCVC